MKIRPFLVRGIILVIGALANPLASAQDTGWYLGAGAGTSDVDVSGFDDDTGTKLSVGYRFNRNLGLEGGFTDLGEFDAAGSSVEIDGFQIVGVYSLPAVGEKVSVFGKAGFYGWDGETASGLSDNGTDAAFGLGVQYGAGDWAVRGEWERFDIDGDDVDLISASIVYSFGRPGPRARRRAAPEPKPEKAEIAPPRVTAAPEKEEAPPAVAEPRAAEAQFRLGYRYSLGQGVSKDDREAVRWYRKAAVQGHARAQYNLGAAHANGRGVPANKETAVDWLFKAGQSFIREGKRNLALRTFDTIERVIPGHALARELLTAIRRQFGQ